MMRARLAAPTLWAVTRARNAPLARERGRFGAPQARARANAWLAQYRPGSTAGTVSRGRGAFVVEVLERGALAALLSVDVATGALRLRQVSAAAAR